MEEKEFKSNALEILQKLGLTKEQAEAITLGTIALEKAKIKKAFEE